VEPEFGVTLEQRLGDIAAAVGPDWLASIVQQMPAGLIVAEAPSGRVVAANAQAARILRVPPEKATAAAGSAAYVGLRPDGTEYRPEEWPLSRAIASGEIVDAEVIEVVVSDGSRRLIAISAAPIRDGEGRIVHGVAVFQDVTDRERRERAEREFVTNAAHELLTPLAAITSAVDVLQAGAKEDPRQRDRFLAHAERDCARLGRLARALLVLARAQMGTEAPRTDLVDLAELLEEIAAGLRPVPGVETQVDCPADLALLTNRELVTQALINVGTNAAKFTQRGAIRFRAHRGGDSHVVVQVSDSGVGVPIGEEARIFDRFYRAPESPGGGEGFGLGLAIARQAVNALGGTLELRSSPGAGTTVTITLPGGELVRR
jgi:signal transduction histidine kinase